MPRTVWSSTRRRPASPSSHCLTPYGPGTVWRGQAWDRSLARLRRRSSLRLCFTSRVVVTTSSRTEFPTESTFRTVLALASLPHFLL
ncbi:hypothetical protein Taro_014007 [Colocasia esculenta]|uniref:Uncharacterized protein n=1 Tax=Colocasia esculenta TaxID=4460 RepID=A0A843UH52_COLES|nr:hypothetical protein [Colocasia esculenta]